MIPIETQRLILRDFVELDWPIVHQYAALTRGTAFASLPEAAPTQREGVAQGREDCDPLTATHLRTSCTSELEK